MNLGFKWISHLLKVVLEERYDHVQCGAVPVETCHQEGPFLKGQASGVGQLGQGEVGVAADATQRPETKDYFRFISFNFV